MAKTTKNTKTTKSKGYREKLEETMNAIRKSNLEEDISKNNENLKPSDFNDDPNISKNEKEIANIALTEEHQPVEQLVTENNDSTNQVNDKSLEIKKPATEQNGEPVIKENEEQHIKQNEEPETVQEKNPASEPSQAPDVVQSKNDTDANLTVIKPTLKELQDNNFTGLSLTDIISCYSHEIEQLILKKGEDRDSLSFEEGVAVKWEELHPKKSYPAIPEIHQIIDIITKRTPLKKYEVFERLILNGLKYTKFIR